MAYDNKPNLSNCHFEQCQTDVLSLSGCNKVYGQFVFQSGSALSIPTNAGIGKVWTSNSGGTGTWQVSSTSNGVRITKSIYQPSHGFNVNDVVGWSGGTYNKPIADGTYDGEVLGIVNKVSGNTFELTQTGYVTGLTAVLVANNTYFLSDLTAGLLTTNETTLNGHIVKPMLIATSSSTGWVLSYAGYQVSTGGTIAAISEFTITGNSVTTGFTVNHGLSKQFVSVEVVKNSSPYATIYTNIERPNANCVCITFDTAPASGQQYKILIIN
jgi:hypothetical protein